MLVRDGLRTKAKTSSASEMYLSKSCSSEESMVLGELALVKNRCCLWMAAWIWVVLGSETSGRMSGSTSYNFKVENVPEDVPL